MAEDVFGEFRVCPSVDGIVEGDGGEGIFSGVSVASSLSEGSSSQDSAIYTFSFLTLVGGCLWLVCWERERFARLLGSPR